MILYFTAFPIEHVSVPFSIHIPESILLCLKKLWHYGLLTFVILPLRNHQHIMNKT